MRMSETIAEIATALSKAQGQIDAASKSSNNPHFKSKYADLNALREVIREPLAVNDLSILQFPRVTSTEVEIETMLLHKSGEFFAETTAMPFGQKTAQAIGSALTYARRYSLSSMLSLGAEDDDGNAATQEKPTEKEPMSVALKKKSLEVALKGTEEFRDYWKELPKSDRDQFTEEYKSELKAVAAKAHPAS